MSPLTWSQPGPPANQEASTDWEWARLLFLDLRIKQAILWLSPPWRLCPSLEQQWNRRSYATWAFGLGPTCLFLDLAPSKHQAGKHSLFHGSGHTQKPSGKDDHKCTFSHWIEQAGRWSGRQFRTGKVRRKGSWECFKIQPRRTIQIISMNINLRKSSFKWQKSHSFSCATSSLSISRPCHNKLRSYKDSCIEETAPKYLPMLPRKALSDELQRKTWVARWIGG